MADILAIPAEFDTIRVGYVGPGMSPAYGKKWPMPRPPLGPFTHHAVRTFAKTCSEGQVGYNWHQHLIFAQQTWKDLDVDERSSLSQAAERDKKRYDEQVKEQPAGASTQPKLDEKLAGTGIAPSTFDLFKQSPIVRSRLYEAEQGDLGSHGFDTDMGFRWLWGRIEEEEKTQWRDDAKRRLDVTNEARRLKGENELVLDTVDPAQHRKKLKESQEDAVDAPKEPEEVAEDEQMESKEEAEDEEEQIESQEVAEGKHNESQEVAEDDDDAEAERTEGEPLDLLPWISTEDQNLRKKKKKTSRIETSQSASMGSTSTHNPMVVALICPMGVECNCYGTVDFT